MRCMSCQAVSPAGVVLDTVTTGDDGILIAAHSAAHDAACPDCGTASAQILSRCERRLLDLPSHGRSVHLRIQVRRFRGNRDGQRRIFSEPLHDTTLYGRPGARRDWRRLCTTLALPWGAVRVCQPGTAADAAGERGHAAS